MARCEATIASSGLSPFSNLVDASVRDLSRDAVRRMLGAWKVADSNRIVCVSSVTSEPAPPITPASASGFFSSAITSMSVVSSRSSPSSVTSLSPSLARLTMIFSPPTAEKSNAWSGWPASSMT